MGSLFFLSSCILSFFLSPPLHPEVLPVHVPVVIMAQKSLLMAVSMEMLNNMAVSVKENKNSFSFHFPLLFAVLFLLFLCLPSSMSPATSYEVFSWLHLVFISWHFLAAFKTQTQCACLHVCVCVCVCWVGRRVVRIGGLLLFVDTAGVDLAPQWSLCLFRLYSSWARKGQDSTGCQAEGHRRDKREGAFPPPYILVASVSTAFTLQKHTTVISRPLLYLFSWMTFTFIIIILSRFKLKTQTPFFLSGPSRWSCTQATGPMKTTTSPWRVASTSTPPTPRTATPPSTWQGWSHQTRARISVRWRRLPGSAARRCCWSSWVSVKIYETHTSIFLSTHSGNELNHVPFALLGRFDVILCKTSAQPS